MRILRNTYISTVAVVALGLFSLLVTLPQVAHAFSLSGMLGGFFIPKESQYEAAEPRSLHASETPTLKAAINLDPNPAKGGGEITVIGGVALVPELGPSGTLADIEVARTGADQISIYVVREGDTISQIADLFGVSTNTVVWANDLRGSTIQPGQILVILPVSGITHTVQKGDTLESIVKKYKAEMSDVLAFNNLKAGASLSVGEKVVVPHGTAPESIRMSAEPRATARGSGGPSLSGYFLRPVIGGWRSQGLHGYNAIDIALPVGTNVVASASGEVIISRNVGYNGGYGQYIVIRHPNGTQTLYAHLSKNHVFADAQVVQGQVIGEVGNTGRSTGPHLHFEVRGATNPF